MTSPKPTGRASSERRPALTRAQLIRAAIDFADVDGIVSLTMRKLGEAVGVEAMSLYNHVANKSELLDGMVDLVFDSLERARGLSTQAPS